MEVLINNRQKRIQFNKRRICAIAEEIMRFEGLPENAELSLVFCDDDFIQKLNDQHLGKDEPTDVLSFPMEEVFESEIRLMCDIVISIETACRQATKLKHSVGLEVIFLLIHGLLHLRKYDHDGKEDFRRMKEREVTIFSHLCDQKLLKGIEVNEEHSPLVERAAAKGPGTTRKAAPRRPKKEPITHN